MTDLIDETSTIVLTSMVSTFVVTCVAVLIVQPDLIPSINAVPFIIAAGLLKSLPLFIYFRAIREEDSTVIATVTNSGPFITVILAFLVLGERLELTQYIGIGILISSVLVLGVLEGENNISMSRGVALAILVTFLFSGQHVLYKIALERTTFWATVFNTHAVAAGVGLTGLVDHRTRAELGRLFKRSNPKATLGVILSETISSFSAIIQFAALSIGFVSVVAPVAAVSHLFVFLLVGILATLGVEVDTDTTKREWIYRGGIGIFVVIGILLVS